ncbi:MAG TPA: hypothetical protein VG713_18170 [Pirellulales bacterium]|nr:hypothetical protein [Pirellulales bacterium]
MIQAAAKEPEIDAKERKGSTGREAHRTPLHDLEASRSFAPISGLFGRCGSGQFTLRLAISRLASGREKRYVSQ